MKTPRILIVDDEKDILEFLKYNLTKEGFSVKTCSDSTKAIDKAKSFRPDLVLLDVMMPEIDGIEICMELRNINYLKHSIIALLSARSEDYSQIAAFEAGADDYINKPIRPKVLIKRLNALLKRKQQEIAPSCIALDKLSIDKEKHEIMYNDAAIHLAKKEFDLLYLLASKPGKVFSREEIFSRVWEDETFICDRTIDVHIRKIRDKIDDKYIRTYKGIGYAFTP